VFGSENVVWCVQPEFVAEKPQPNCPLRSGIESHVFHLIDREKELLTGDVNQD
jgi:hypothetical protein